MSTLFSIPRFTLPRVIAVVGSRLPQWPHSLALAAALNVAAKWGVFPEESLRQLEGRQFVVDAIDTGGQACFTYRDALFRPLLRRPQDPDLAFSANLSTFLQLLARQEDPDTLFFNRELAITGDTELGLLVKNLLDAVEWPSFSALQPFRR